MKNERNRNEEELELLLQIAADGAYIFISQCDENNHDLYELERPELANDDPMKIIYDRLPDHGTKEDYSKLLDNYNVRLFCSEYYDDAQPYHEDETPVTL